MCQAWVGVYFVTLTCDYCELIALEVQIASIFSFRDLATGRGRETVFDGPEDLLRCQDQPLYRPSNAPRGTGGIMVQRLLGSVQDGFGSEKGHR